MPPRVQPGNPDWLEWVEDLVSKAEERGEKSVQTYKKALSRLSTTASLCLLIPFLSLFTRLRLALSRFLPPNRPPTLSAPAPSLSPTRTKRSNWPE